MQDSYILALDTSGGACTACVFDTGTRAVLAAAYEAMPYGQATRIMPMVDGVVRQAGVCRTQIGAIYTCNGPGYFTGIRIGLSTARGLALGLQVPLYGISSLQAMAFQVQHSPAPPIEYTVIMESKRQDFYVQSFQGTTATSPITSLLAQHISPKSHIVGSGIQRYLQTTHNPHTTVIDCPPYPSADTIARGVYDLLQRGDTGAVYTGAAPLYLRAADVRPPPQTGT